MAADFLVQENRLNIFLQNLLENLILQICTAPLRVLFISTRLSRKPSAPSSQKQKNLSNIALHLYSFQFHTTRAILAILGVRKVPETNFQQIQTTPKTRIKLRMEIQNLRTDLHLTCMSKNHLEMHFAHPKAFLCGYLGMLLFPHALLGIWYSETPKRTSTQANDTSYRSFDFFGYFYFFSFYDKDNFLSLYNVLWHNNLLSLIITFYHQISFSLDPSHISLIKNQPN